MLLNLQHTLEPRRRYNIYGMSDLQRLAQTLLVALKWAGGQSVAQVVIELVQIWIPNADDQTLSDIADGIEAVYRTTRDPDFLWLEINGVLAKYLGGK